MHALTMMNRKNIILKIIVVKIKLMKILKQKNLKEKTPMKNMINLMLI